MTISELMKKTRSYRTFKSGVTIDNETLLSFIDNARISAATMNLQPLKYRIVNGEEVARVLPLTRWAGALRNIKLPPEDHGPSAFIVICHDNAVTPFKPIFLKDVGITAEVIMLSATEAGYGGCIIGSASADALRDVLSLPEGLEPELVLALGVPDETVVLTDAVDGNVTYYRDENNVHYSPKRSLEDVVIKG